MSLTIQEDQKVLEEYRKQHILDAQDYRNRSKSPQSIRTYKFAWKKFTEWCEKGGYEILQPINNSYELLAALFISSMAKNRELKNSSITCYLAGLKHFYAEHGISLNISHPEIQRIRSGIKRDIGTKQTQKKPLTTETIKQLVDSIGHLVWPIEVRDKALILVGFAGAFRRSELVGIDIEHLEFGEYGVSITLPKSKTDQEMQGRVIDIPKASDERYCPIKALQDWIRCASIESGPVFLSVHKSGKITNRRMLDGAVATILKKRCEPLGISADVSGHSLRSGHVTSAIKNGTPESWIMRQTGHSCIDTLREYERMQKEFEANSANRLGL